MKAAAFNYHRARDVADALAALAQLGSEARAIAGGCSLGPMMNLRLARPSALVDLRGLEELRQLGQSRDSMRIGACRTHAEIEDGDVPDVTRGFLPHVARGIAYRPVRNRGTIGGSLAHADPAADWPSALLALGATLHVRSASGERAIPASEFGKSAYATALSLNEILVAVEVPVLSERARWGYHKVTRKTGEFANAIGAVVVDPARGYARVVCGAVEAAPVVLPETSAALKSGAEAAIKIAAAEIAQVFPRHDAVFRQQHTAAVTRAIAGAEL